MTAQVHFIQPFHANQLEAVVRAGYMVVVVSADKILAEYRGPDPVKM